MQPAQFEVNDERPLDQVIQDICKDGYLPSFCTACYRNGRTGDRFMALAKIGEIQNLCQPNAILTFKEYLEDFATPETRAVGEAVIADYLKQIPNANCSARPSSGWKPSPKASAISITRKTPHRRRA